MGFLASLSESVVLSGENMDFFFDILSDDAALEFPGRI